MSGVKNLGQSWKLLTLFDPTEQIRRWKKCCCVWQFGLVLCEKTGHLVWFSVKMLAIHSGSQWKLAIWYGSLWKCWPFILVLSENWLRFGVVGWKTSHSVGISVKPDSELFLCCHVSPLQPLGISDLGTAAPATPLHPQKGIEESNVWVLQWEHFTIAYAHPWCKLTGSDAETVIRHAPLLKGSD